MLTCSPHVKLNQQFTFDQQRIVSPLLYLCSKLARDVLHTLWGRGEGPSAKLKLPVLVPGIKLINRDALVFIRKCPGLDIARLLRLLPPHLLPNTRQHSSAIGDNTMCTICSIKLRNSRHMLRFRTVPLCTHTISRSEFHEVSMHAHSCVHLCLHTFTCVSDTHVHITCFISVYGVAILSQVCGEYKTLCCG